MKKNSFQEEPNKASKFINRYEGIDLESIKKNKLLKIEAKAKDVLDEIDKYRNNQGLEAEEQMIVDSYFVKIQKMQEDFKSKIDSLDSFEQDNNLDILSQNIENLGNGVEGFKELSEGQKLLVSHNFKQLFLSNTKEGAQKDFKQDLSQSNIFQRIWKGALKEYKLAKLEKDNLKNNYNLEEDAYKEMMKNLVKGVQDYGPEVKIGEQNKIEIQYASKWEGLTSEQEEQIDKFNEIADKYSNIPYEWSLDSATPKQRDKFRKMRGEYEDQREILMNLKKEQDGSDSEEEKGQKALLYINHIDGQIQINQFLNSHPEVEKELSNIKDEKVWKKVAKTLFAERGIYMGAGFVLRSATTAVIGAVALPFAAGGIGAWRANVRAKKNLKERDINARYGQKDNSEQAKNVADLGERIVQYRDNSKDPDKVKVRKGLIGKIDDLIEKIASTKDDNKKQKLLIKLKARLRYTENKLEDGLINFGVEKNRLNNQYLLIQKLSEARLIAETNSLGEDGITYLDKLSSRLEKYLDFKNRKINKTRKKFIIKKTITGGLISAGFATAGYYIRHLIGGQGVFDKSSETNVEVRDEVSNPLLYQKKYNLGDKLSEYKQNIAQGSQRLYNSAKGDTLKIPSNQNVIANQDSSDVLDNQEYASGDSVAESSFKLNIKEGNLGEGDNITNSSSGENEFYINKNVGDELNDEEMAKIFALQGEEENSLKDILSGADKVAIIKRGQGVSQALKLDKILDEDMKATVINPNGEEITGDIHLAHEGDTVFEKDGQIYILKTSEVTVSEKDSLARAWLDKFISKRGGKTISKEEEEILDLDKNGEVEWDEAKAAYDGLDSKNPKVIEVDKVELERESLLRNLGEQKKVVKDLENKINEYRQLNGQDDFSQEDDDIRKLLDNYQKENDKLAEMEYKLKEFNNSEQVTPEKLMSTNGEEQVEKMGKEMDENLDELKESGNLELVKQVEDQIGKVEKLEGKIEDYINDNLKDDPYLNELREVLKIEADKMDGILDELKEAGNLELVKQVEDQIGKVEKLEGKIEDYINDLFDDDENLNALGTGLSKEADKMDENLDKLKEFNDSELEGKGQFREEINETQLKGKNIELKKQEILETEIRDNSYFGDQFYNEKGSSLMTTNQKGFSVKFNDPIKISSELKASEFVFTGKETAEGKFFDLYDKTPERNFLGRIGLKILHGDEQGGPAFVDDEWTYKSPEELEELGIKPIGSNSSLDNNILIENIDKENLDSDILNNVSTGRAEYGEISLNTSNNFEELKPGDEVKLTTIIDGKEVTVNGIYNGEDSPFGKINFQGSKLVQNYNGNQDQVDSGELDSILSKTSNWKVEKIDKIDSEELTTDTSLQEKEISPETNETLASQTRGGIKDEEIDEIQEKEIPVQGVEDNYSIFAEKDLPEGVRVKADASALEFMKEHNIKFDNGELKGEFGSIIFGTEPGAEDQGITELIEFKTMENGDVRCIVTDQDGTQDIMDIDSQDQVIPVQGIEDNYSQETNETLASKTGGEIIEKDNFEILDKKDVFQEVSYDDKIDEINYFDPIKDAEMGVNNLDENIVLNINNKKIEINSLDLINTKGEIKDGEVMKHFVAQGTDGKKYDLITREHWKVLHKGDNNDDWNKTEVEIANKNGYVGKIQGEIDYSIKEIDNNLSESPIDGTLNKILETHRNEDLGLSAEDLKSWAEDNINNVWEKDGKCFTLVKGSSDVERLAAINFHREYGNENGSGIYHNLTPEYNIPIKGQEKYSIISWKKRI